MVVTGCLRSAALVSLLATACAFRPGSWRLLPATTRQQLQLRAFDPSLVDAASSAMTMAPTLLADANGAMGAADLALEPRSLTAWDPTGTARFGWWVIIAYCFAAQAKICDDYFVPAIEACSKQFKIPQDVAGATLMAFGCNGPEMFVNGIALFITHTDVGVGCIVGSEVFNLLCIVGGSVLVAPILPLPIERYAFARDASFYAVATVMLGLVLADGEVTRARIVGERVRIAVTIESNLIREGRTQQANICEQRRSRTGLHMRCRTSASEPPKSSVNGHGLSPFLAGCAQ